LAKTATDIIAAVRDAGVVGAGGAGFPTHVKLANAVDTFIANGAECEPILETDKYLMIHDADKIVRGLALAMGQVGAAKGYVAIKAKNKKAVEAVREAVTDYPDIEVAELGNYYPAGDEQVLIRQVTGRIVPPGGLPFMAGVSVNNVLTLKQIAEAVDKTPVTSRAVTVGGEVARPVTVEVPVGTPIRDLIEHAGGVTIDEYEIVVGGPIMGPVASIDDPITKIIGGIIVLPKDHIMVRFKQQPLDTTTHKAKSCYTCKECTNLCPRNAMGHAIYPSKIMSYSWYIDEILGMIESGDIDPAIRSMISESMLCCQCGVCEQVACSFDLSPNKIYALIRDAARKAGLKFDFEGKTSDDSLFEYRKVPTLAYAKKMDIDRYIVYTDFEPLGTFLPETVKIPMSQHIGAPSVPTVKKSDAVKAGDVIGAIPEGALGATVHASINGKIEEITDSYIVIRRTGS